VREMIRYTTPISDSDRWRRFEHRAGDVVISAPQKSGMTWTQMLCALVVFDGTVFPASLDEMSPWLDMLTRSENEVFGLFARQRHRRFIKTHTPLDGLPLRDDVTYLVVGRDPRDVAISFEHHLANVDGQKLSATLAEATGTVLELPPAAPDEPSARSWRVWPIASIPRWPGCCTTFAPAGTCAHSPTWHFSTSPTTSAILSRRWHAWPTCSDSQSTGPG